MKIDQKERKNSIAKTHKRPKNTLDGYLNEHIHKTPVMNSHKMRNMHGPAASPDDLQHQQQNMTETWKMKYSSGATPEKGGTPFSTTTPKEARHTLHTFDAVPLYDPVR